MVNPREARDAGRGAVASMRRKLAESVVRQLEQRDPELLGSLTEVGVVRREWIEEGHGPISTAEPMDVITRLLERSVERRPSLLASLGLSTIQLLSAPTDDNTAEGALPSRLTVAFTDLEGFTKFTAEQGDEAASELLVKHHRAVGPVVRSRGGRVVKRLGDGLLITFPEPEAAVLACIELVEGEPVPLRLRAGLHMGDVMVTRDDVIGHVVNIAARVAESAKGGEVLVTTSVRDQVAPHLAMVEFGRAKRKSFKGIGEPVLVSRASRSG